MSSDASRVASFGLIVLAAGDSRRMGAPKGLLPVGDAPLVAWQVGRFRAAGGNHAVIVTGKDHELYEKATRDLTLARNPDPDRGPFSSLRIGLEWAVRQGVRGVFVLPVDVPAPCAAVWAALVTEAPVTRPVHEGRRGHPVGLGTPFVQSLLEAAHDSRLDHEIRDLPPGAVVDVVVDDPSVTLNLNDPEAYSCWFADRRSDRD